MWIGPGNCDRSFPCSIVVAFLHKTEDITKSGKNVILENSELFTEFKIVIFKLIVENPKCLFFLSTKQWRTGCKVKTGVELSDFCVLQYISLLLSPLLFSSLTRWSAFVKNKLLWTWEKYVMTMRVLCWFLMLDVHWQNSIALARLKTRQNISLEERIMFVNTAK